MDRVFDRAYVSQFTRPTFGLRIQQDGNLVDPDGQVVNATLIDESDNTTTALTVDRNDVGDYTVTLSSTETQETGYYTLEWTYTLNLSTEVYRMWLDIGPADPAYDNLDDDFKQLVEHVWARFADLFDSPMGGPHLLTYFQTNWSRARVARLLATALRRLNVIAQPHFTYTLDGQGGKQFPLGQWGGTLEQALYVEVLKHLVRSYVEQPELVGASVARTDRRDYMSRWESVLRAEQEDLKDSLDTFRIRHMGLGQPGVMVSGGVYGRGYGPTSFPKSAVARPRYAYRHY